MAPQAQRWPSNAIANSLSQWFSSPSAILLGPCIGHDTLSDLRATDFPSMLTVADPVSTVPP